MTLTLRLLPLAVVSFQALGQEVNVYGRPMTNCGSGHSAGCTYAAGDAGAHQVCVTSLPQGFSSNTGQGPWSDEFQGQPWCICIWAYSNFILHQDQDLPLECEAIPSKVLESQYSLDKFEQCGSMASQEGCGPEDIRRSIQRLCDQCAGDAPDAAAINTLKGKCNAILAVAPAAQMLYSNDVSGAKGASALQSTSGMSPLTLGMFVLGIAGLSAGVMVRVIRKKTNTQSEDGQTGHGELFDQETALEQEECVE